MANDVTQIRGADFDREVLKAETPVLVDFTAAWCGPCKALSPILDKIASESAGRYRVVKVDVDEAPEVAARYGIRAMPTVMLFKNGQPTATKVGLANKDTYTKLLEG